MLEYCEHVFEDPHHAHPELGAVVVDLSLDIGPSDQAYALRYHREDDVYEIFEHTHPDESTGSHEEEEPSFTDESVAAMSDFEIFPDVDEPLADEDLRTTLKYANRLERDETGSRSFEYGHGHTRCPIDE